MYSLHIVIIEYFYLLGRLRLNCYNIIRNNMSNLEEYSNDEKLIVRFLTSEASEEEKLLMKEKMKEDDHFGKLILKCAKF